MMELETFIKDIEGIVDDVELGTLSPKTIFRELSAWDSLAVLTVTDMVDLEYGVLLNKKDFQNANTLEELSKCICAKGGRKAV